jgi:hypothetical protein
MRRREPSGNAAPEPPLRPQSRFESESLVRFDWQAVASLALDAQNEPMATADSWWGI